MYNYLARNKMLARVLSPTLEPRSHGRVPWQRDIYNNVVNTFYSHSPSGGSHWDPARKEVSPQQETRPLARYGAKLRAPARFLHSAESNFKGRWAWFARGPWPDSALGP